MITRRNVLKLAGLTGAAGVAGVAGLSGCAGAAKRSGTEAGAMQLISSHLPRAAGDAAAAAGAVQAVTAFSADLFARLAGAKQANLVCSPYSVATALGMSVQGARGDTAAQMLHVLHASTAAELATGLNAVDLALSTRSRTVTSPNGGKPDRVTLAAANSLWGQRGIDWQPAFLDVLATDFGTGLRAVDYATAAPAAQAAINGWVSQQTQQRIPELIPDGVINALTRLVLVNALYLKAPWATPFADRLTRKAPFQRLDGSSVPVDLMGSADEAHFASGPGWSAADLPYAGSQLAMAVVVPEPGRFAEVEKSLTGPWLTRLLAGFQPALVQIGLPRWKIRTQAELIPALSALGMSLAFGDQADFGAMTAQERLQIGAVLHEGFIAVDEAGTEAAASTAVVMRATAGFGGSPRRVIADRPFFYAIHDIPTRMPLFIGRVLDPTAL